MDDVIDVVLHDEETVREMRLVTELMVVASLAPGQLDTDVIDGALGLEREPSALPSQRRAH